MARREAGAGQGVVKICVKVKANSKTSSVESLDGNNYVVRVNEPAKEGRANLAVVALLSEYFSVPKSRISILKGQASKNKLILIQ